MTTDNEYVNSLQYLRERLEPLVKAGKLSKQDLRSIWRSCTKHYPSDWELQKMLKPEWAKFLRKRDEK